MPNTEAIRLLNDQFRRTFIGGKVVATAGIMALDRAIDIITAVRHYTDFNEDNDPYNEHDFGALDCDGAKVFWKVDYYNKTLTAGSPDPSNPLVTTRVLTLMLASEY